jgi:hypothetical protein
MRLRTSAAAVALTALAVTGLAAVPASAGPAPWCLGHKLDARGAKDKLWVWNSCRHTVSYKVRLANVPDLACRQLRPRGGTDYYQWSWPGRFDGLVTC